ncbi:PucR family transcriptional regulator ligand-binding domain-containing protein, partial [Streptomyces sp. NPDC002265]|uniref:PucR family transcriptional regulator ligand-binding domain-containing protein n=1 Tax=Streptomyces sp. NPDC002265 TaxID=3154415 RepID=UPI00331F5BE1
MPDTPAPAVPPTPPVMLSALLAREDLALRQIAGPSDPDLVIHWVHTSEMADPYPYLLGGELLLSAGVHVPQAAAPDGGPADTGGAEGWEEYFDDYVSRIVAAGGAALGFGLAPVHDTVPRALVAACEAHALPLLEVPPQTTFSGVARAVWQLMAQSRLAELRRTTEAQQSLAAAASRPDPVPSVLRRLAQRVNGWTVLYGPDGTELATAGRLPVPAAAGGTAATTAAAGGTATAGSTAGGTVATAAGSGARRGAGGTTAGGAAARRSAAGAGTTAGGSTTGGGPSDGIKAAGTAGAAGASGAGAPAGAAGTGTGAAGAGAGAAPAGAAGASAAGAPAGAAGTGTAASTGTGAAGAGTTGAGTAGTHCRGRRSVVPYVDLGAGFAI